MNERHRKKRLDALRFVLAMPRSIWYNFKLLPFQQARKLPLLISHRTRVVDTSGSLELNAEQLRIGLVKIGFVTYQGSDFRYDRTRLDLRGKLIVEGELTTGAGSSITITESGTMTVGDHCNIGPKSLVICNREITFGDRVRASWCCTFMDTDQHNLVDDGGQLSNPDRPIVMGDNVWIGCHTIVTKGTQLASCTTVGAGAVVHGRHEEMCTVLAGNPAEVVRRGVKRQIN